MHGDKQFLRNLNSAVENVAAVKREDNSLLRIEFFFYAGLEDDASNLAIELSQLGYKFIEVYKLPERLRWSVSGWTHRMSQEVDDMIRWASKMNGLAEENNAEFDGWGTLLDQDEEFEQAFCSGD